ncbi:XK-related protein 6-like [Anthonomus grandis grandis]|uniref:XK-related protein 6-like n=1 Tax=Anthonomus grandis grandis TaxID=2921223 RepID=UPI0021661B80|nr:XK-related protein 6-like [Anthonomus grandis grandis]
MAETCTVVHFSREPSLARIDTIKTLDPPSKIAETNQHFGAFYVSCIVLSIVTYITDLALTITLLYFYSSQGYGVYFALTLSFLLLPAICMSTISLRWYIIDHDDPSVGRASLGHWLIRIVFLVLQISPLLRYIETVVYGIRSNVARKLEADSQQPFLYRRMLDEDTNSSLLRLFHCFLHCAPQAIMQLVFLLSFVMYPDTRGRINLDVSIIQAWTVFTSIISIAWSLTSYHRSVRFARDDKDKIKWIGLLVAFCWQLMSALSRILALSLLAAILPAWMGVICALHWGVMSFWLAIGQQQTAACSNRCEELLLSVALGLAYVLAFISPRDGPTRYVYLVYYLVCFMENTGALVVWCFSNNSSNNPFLYYGAAGSQVLSFVLAITFLIVYYKYCHPSLSSKRSKIPRNSSDYIGNDKPCYSKTSYSFRTSS